MTVNRAVKSRREAALSSDFGMQMALKWFGQEVLDELELPVYVRGRHKGKLKGYVVWEKIDKGGWVSEGYAAVDGVATGYVERRVGQVVYKAICKLESSVHGTWPGEVLMSDSDMKRREAEKETARRLESFSKLDMY